MLVVVISTNLPCQGRERGGTMAGKKKSKSRSRRNDKGWMEKAKDSAQNTREKIGDWAENLTDGK